tara:strand:+ start:8851 stop:9402 length:552 start_codon:yes stop_codon:yes gene_type:complete
MLTLDLVKVTMLWALLALLVVITVYDLYHFIIPDELTITVSFIAVGLAGYQYWLLPDFLGVGYNLGAALLGSLFFFTLWFVSKGTWLGFGDVKLALPLGFALGYQSVFSFVVMSFWIGAVVSLAVIGWQKLRFKLQRGKGGLHLPGEAITMKSAVPFAPFLVASFITILFTHFDVLRLFQFSI